MEKRWLEPLLGWRKGGWNLCSAMEPFVGQDQVEYPFKDDAKSPLAAPHAPSVFFGIVLRCHSIRVPRALAYRVNVAWVGFEFSPISSLWIAARSIPVRSARSPKLKPCRLRSARKVAIESRNGRAGGPDARTRWLAQSPFGRAAQTGTARADWAGCCISARCFRPWRSCLKATRRFLSGPASSQTRAKAP